LSYVQQLSQGVAMRLIAVKEIVELAVAGKDDVLDAMFSTPFTVVSDWYSSVRSNVPGALGTAIPNASEDVVRDVLEAMQVLIVPGQPDSVRAELEARRSRANVEGWQRCLQLLIDRFPPGAHQLELFASNQVRDRKSLVTRVYPLLYVAIRSAVPEVVDLCAGAAADEQGRSVRISDAFDALCLTERGPDLLRFLLDRSSVNFVPDPDFPEIGLQRIALLSVQYGHVEMVRELAARGVDFSQTLTRGDNVWGFNGQPVRLYDERRKTSEFNACAPILVAPSVAMIELLESLGADLNVGAPKILGGENALFMALRSGSDEVLRYLVEERGFDVNVHNDEGATPLHFAVRGGTFEQAKYLLEHGAKVDARDHEGWTPIKGLFASRDVKSKFRLLVECGANFFDRNYVGESELGAIGEARNVLLAAELLRSALADPHGASSAISVGVANCRGEVATDYLVNAIKKKQFDLAFELMRSIQWDPSLAEKWAAGPVHAFIEAGGARGALARKSGMVRDVIDFALSRGMDIDARDGTGHTLLMHAVASKNVGAIAYLIERGADHTVRSDKGKPLESLTRDEATRAAVRSALTGLEIGAALRGGGSQADPVSAPRAVGAVNIL
jgi:ankyrin repeat protein